MNKTFEPNETNIQNDSIQETREQSDAYLEHLAYLDSVNGAPVMDENPA